MAEWMNQGQLNLYLFNVKKTNSWTLALMDNFSLAGTGLALSVLLTFQLGSRDMKKKYPKTGCFRVNQ